MEDYIIVRNKEELLEYVRQKEKFLYAVCLTYTNRSKTEIEDLYQEILCRVFEGFKSYKEQGKFFSWFSTIVINTAVTYYRYEKKRIKLFNNIKTEEQTVAYDPLNEKDEKEKFYKVLDTLSLKDRNIMMLYLQDYSITEIAQMTNNKYTNVTTKIHRLKKVIKNIYNKLNVII